MIRSNIKAVYTEEINKLITNLNTFCIEKLKELPSKYGCFRVLTRAVITNNIKIYKI